MIYTTVLFFYFSPPIDFPFSYIHIARILIQPTLEKKIGLKEFALILTLMFYPFKEKAMNII